MSEIEGELTSRDDDEIKELMEKWAEKYFKELFQKSFDMAYKEIRNEN